MDCIVGQPSARHSAWTQDSEEFRASWEDLVREFEVSHNQIFNIHEMELF